MINIPFNKCGETYQSMLTVITPVYNGERFIGSCIQNVIDQDCSQVEHTIIDGGSSDRTVEIIKEYAGKYPHIHWISEKDNGQSDAMNKGILKAKGSILGILNVDDFYAANVLNRVVEIFKELPELSFLVGNCNVWNDKNELLYVNIPSKTRLKELLLGWHINPHPVNPSAYFYHRSIHQQVGMYDVNDHYAMDLDFILKAVQVAHIKYVNEVWGNYRMIIGTKTAKDKAAGQSEQRAKKLFESYQRQLSPMEKLDFLIEKFFRKIGRKLNTLFRRLNFQ
jgi:glycosyltransferase involved in cell wall biosynthesis